MAAIRGVKERRGCESADSISLRAQGQEKVLVGDRGAKLCQETAPKPSSRGRSKKTPRGGS